MVAPTPEGGQGYPVQARPHSSQQHQGPSCSFPPRSQHLPLQNTQPALQWGQPRFGSQSHSMQLPVAMSSGMPSPPQRSPSGQSLVHSPRTWAAVPARIAYAQNHATSLLQSIRSVESRLQSAVQHNSSASKNDACENGVVAVGALHREPSPRIAQTTTPTDYSKNLMQRSWSAASAAAAITAEGPGRTLAQRRCTSPLGDSASAVSNPQKVSLGDSAFASAVSRRSLVYVRPRQASGSPRPQLSSQSGVAPVVEHDECQHAQTRRECNSPSPITHHRQVNKTEIQQANQERAQAKPNFPGAKEVDSGAQSADQHEKDVPTAETTSVENAVPPDDAASPEQHSQKPRKCVASPTPRAALCRKKSPRASCSPGLNAGTSRASCYPRVGPIGSPLAQRRSGCFEKADLATVSSAVNESAMEAQQRLVQESGEAASVSARLLLQWMNMRHATEGLCPEEEALVRDIFYETMPTDEVKLVKVDRTVQPELINEFCKEEVESMTRERENQKKHRELMFLHGTRWENVPLICSTGLDPHCGHLSKGSWLGQNAESAHSYAAKGPGPGPFHDGHRLFAMFLVACLPNYADGDEERSFGVWRIMSNKRMCPAYLIIYSAPLKMRASKRSKSKSRGVSPELPQPSCQQPCKAL